MPITNENVTIREGDAINYADRDVYYGIKLYTYGSMAQTMPNNELLLEETYTLMRQTHSILPTGGVEYPFAYGTHSTPIGEYFSHGGGWGGFATLMEINTRSGTEIFILSNGGCATQVNKESN